MWGAGHDQSVLAMINVTGWEFLQLRRRYEAGVAP
jgi:hypothetical protein